MAREPPFEAVVQAARSREQPFSVVGEVQPVRAAVARDARQQSAPLQVVEQRDEVRLLNAECGARARLQHAGVRVDDRQHRKMRRAQVELGQGVDEIAEHFELRAPQGVADVLTQRSELSGNLGNERVHRTVPSRRGALTPARLHGYMP